MRNITFFIMLGYHGDSNPTIVTVEDLQEKIQQSEKGVIENSKYDQLNVLYSEEPKKSMNRVKRKKINDNLTSNLNPMFKKGSMQAPPNLDMIAKFALEKER